MPLLGMWGRAGVPDRRRWSPPGRTPCTGARRPGRQGAFHFFSSEPGTYRNALGTSLFTVRV